MLAAGRSVIIGEFSHGTPDITNSVIRAAMLDTYGKFAIDHGDKVRVGFHLYTYGKRFHDHPGDNARYAEPEWYEGRDNSFWKDWGFPSHVKLFSGEMGVEGGQGGFVSPAHTYSGEQFAQWCRWWIDYRTMLPGKLDAACMYTYGYNPDPRWQNYDVRRFAGILEDFWRGRR
jgi:hypothetical protein